ncbi:MAG: hypothetical protein RLZ04_555 [Actinomycetota bacterium]
MDATNLTDGLALGIPAELPIAERADELAAAIRDHQVVIVAGETGSGKSTQLPKICLALGRGADGMIGHTQPRRVAARTIGERIAEELGTEIGTVVGWSVRFTDRTAPNTRVRVMTDGILLAEIQRDRMLRRYDTIIVDEAHERSLNIDFLLGYLAQLLPKRPDLKLIVTSATIDTERFSAHFGDAPVIEVSGRTYPVEVRYRPIEADGPDGSGDQVQAVLDAVDELAGDGRGDVLVFLSGEREIHDTADALRRQATERGSQLEVLPLYARLSAVEQQRIFQPHRGRRVVLSTNVAETSLTVPGVRYVVDAGTARISRYSHRLKVQRLPIESVSQASANQRAGRCGRVAPGICIRLYDEDDFLGRDAFTEPEILRTNLAAVILQMTALGLGDVSRFPFIDPPDPRAVRDGYALLEELGAIEPGDDDARRRLTTTGKRLARLPIDPRLGRMVLEADRHGCTREVMVIAAALSIQDPRERPAENRAAADEMHARFVVPGSDLLTLVRLWDHLRHQQQELSKSQFRAMCKREHLHYLRVREWQDLFSQLRQVAGEMGIRQATDAGHPDRVHQAVLAGLLSHIGMRDTVTRDYRGAHGSRFALGRESVVSKGQPRWVMASELVETNRLWGRMAAEIKPEWAERLAGPLARRSYGDPTWDPRRGMAVCREQVTLYGLPIVTRTIGYDRVDRAVAREMFIRAALVEGDWTTTHAFWDHNRSFLHDLATMGNALRRVDIIDEATVFAFYDARVGADVVSTRHFDRWWKDARSADRDLLTMRIEHFATAGGASADDFPGTWRQGPLELDVTYRFDPGAPDDGATVHIPLAVLNQMTDDGFDWHVGGMRDDLVDSLLRSLPKEYRRELVPMAEVCARVSAALRHQDRPLVDALADTLRSVTGVAVPPRAFNIGKVDPHLRITFAVHDDHGTVVATGRDLAALRTALAARTRAAIARVAPVDERKGIVTWDIGDLSRLVETTRDGLTVRGYPALVDDGDSVSVRVFTRPELQERVMRGGVRRLLLLAVPVGKRALEQSLPSGMPTTEVLRGDCVMAAADDLIDAAGGPVWEEAAFASLVGTARDEMPELAARLLRTAAEIHQTAERVRATLRTMTAPALADGVADARRHLDRLVYPGFVTATGRERLGDVLRYVRAIEFRVARMPDEASRDRSRMAEVLPLERRYARLLDSLPVDRQTPEFVGLGWTLEELRVSLFAQALGAARGASTTKVARALDLAEG